MESLKRQESEEFIRLCSSPDSSGSWEETQRNDAIMRLCGYCGEEGVDRRPLRVVVVGKHGAGKSSFINGVSAALSEDRWHEYAFTGSMGRGVPITVTNQRHVKCNNGHRERYQNVLLPTLIDVAGLSDELDNTMEELLRLLFYGHLEEDDALMTVYDNIKGSTKEEIRKKYPTCFPHMRVDRVIFVASAEDPLPERLMHCVHQASRPPHFKTERRAVPVFGVLTKKDLIDEKSEAFAKMKKEFMKGLGLNSSRFLLCSNYCDDTDPDCQRTKQLRPELDIPVVDFMVQVCDPALKVICEEQALDGTQDPTQEENENAENARRTGPAALGAVQQMWQNMDPMYRDSMLAAALGLASLMALRFLAPTGGQTDELVKKACSDRAITDTTYKTLLCQEQSSWGYFYSLCGHVLLAFFVGIFTFIFQRFIRRQ